MAETNNQNTSPEEDAYVKQNDPATIARQATERKQAELLKQNEAQRANTGLDYDSAYRGLKSNNFRNFRSALEGSRGLSGGMAQGRQDALSALEMSSMGNFMTGRQRAMNELDAQKAGIASQAQEYGQMQREIASANMQSDYALNEQINTILNTADKTLSPQQKREQLKLLGMSDAEIDQRLAPVDTPNTVWNWLPRQGAKFGDWVSDSGTGKGGDFFRDLSATVLGAGFFGGRKYNEDRAMKDRMSPELYEWWKAQQD